MRTAGPRPTPARAATRPWMWLCTALVISAGCGMPPVPVAKESPRYDFEAGRVALESKRYLDAQTYLKRFLDLNPGHAVADSAQFLMGLAQTRTGSFAEAAVEFAILVREFPRSPLRDDAAYHECLAYFSQMRPAQLDPTFAIRARGCFNEFLLRFPDSELGEEARARLIEISDRLAEKEYRSADMFLSLKRPKAALVYLDEILSRYGNSRWVPQALFLRARCLERLGRLDEAVHTLQRLLASFPDHAVAGPARDLLDRLRQQGVPVPADDAAESEP